MNVTQANRLLRVADALRDADRAHFEFDMSTYGWDNSRARHINAGMKTFVDNHGCGTPACALGHYAVRTDLQRGFKLAKNGCLLESSGIMEVGHSGDYAQEYFGLDEEQLDELFDSSGCGWASDPIEAAQYIENFIRRQGFTVSGSYIPTELAA